jgi:hypothetical protein
MKKKHRRALARYIQANYNETMTPPPYDQCADEDTTIRDSGFEPAEAIHVYDWEAVPGDLPVCGDTETDCRTIHPECEQDGAWPTVGAPTDWRCPTCNRPVCAYCRILSEIKFEENR